MKVSFGATLQNGLSSQKGKEIYQALSKLFNEDPAISTLGRDEYTPGLEFTLSSEAGLKVRASGLNQEIPFNGDITSDPSALEKVAQAIFNVLAGRSDPEWREPFAQAMHKVFNTTSAESQKVGKTWSSRIDGFYTAKKGGNP